MTVAASGVRFRAKGGFFVQQAAAAIALASLASCGGGSSGGSGGTPTPAATISFTSSADASVVENTSGAVYSASATLSNGGAVSFSIAGGADAGDFTISQAGALSFVSAPDYERPADANEDNTYEVTLRASGSGASRDLSVTITVTNDKEGISVTRIANGFNDPVCVSFLNSSDQVFFTQQGRIAVGERGGKVYAVDGTTGAKTLLADTFAGRPATGMLDCQTFLQNKGGYYSGFYAALRYTDGSVVMQRFDNTQMYDSVLLPTGTPSVRLKLIDGPDQQFYMAVADISPSAAQDSASPLGKLFKLDQRDIYASAAIRPGLFYPSIIGDGIRDPGGASAVNGLILLADRGGSIEHELDFFDPAARPLDFGWPSYEGTQAIVSSPPAAVNGPTVVYPYGTGVREGTGIVSGYVYDGPATTLKGHYIFGDENGLIWSIPLAVLTDGYLHKAADLENRTADFEPDAGVIDSPVGFATDDMGRFYVLDSDGELFRVDGV